MRTPRYETPEHTVNDIDHMHFFKERMMTVAVKDHEIYMVFNNDCDAVNFDEWWHAQGKELFLDSLKAAVK